MSMMLAAAICTACVGIFVGIFLGVAGIAFKVQTDEREEKVLAALPGNNCGGCGYPGCSGLASAIVKGEAPVNACPVGGAAVGVKVAEIMGTSAGESVRMCAFVACAGDCEKASDISDYSGPTDCRMMNIAPAGGPKGCREGCLGGGTCVSVCPFDAIHVAGGIAVVDKDACKACGKCVSACPRHLISLVPYDAKHFVKCSSHSKGPEVMKVCRVGCIGCSLCAKNCPKDAIVFENNLARIDQEKCVGCGVCVDKCPKKAII